MTTQASTMTLDYYLGLQYPVTITPDETGGFVAEIADLPGCFSQGETLEEVYANIEEARQLWLEVAFEDGQDIPLPRDQEQYSGKFIIRGPRSLHMKLDQLAHREGVSFNQFAVATLSHAVGLNESRVVQRPEGGSKASRPKTPTTVESSK